MDSKKTIAGISLEKYAEITARYIGTTNPDEINDAVASAGIKESQWAEALQGWSEAFTKTGQPGELNQEYQYHLTRALEKLCPDVKSLGFDDYVAGTVLAYTGTPIEKIAATFQYELREYMLVGYQWVEKLVLDQWQMTRFKLLVQKGIAEHTGSAGRDKMEWFPGSMIRARKCWNCGGFKLTVSPTAYIYCDYCGTLFDYDSKKEVEDPAALDPEDVESTLAAVTNEKLKAAFEANDRKEYGRIMRWRTSVMIEVCPQSYSPRVKDPTYCQTLLDDLLVPWSTVTRFDQEYMKESRRVDKAQDRAFNAVVEYMGAINTGEDPDSPKVMAKKKEGLKRTLELLRISQEVWELEVSLLEENGILAKHPDGLDRETFLYINRSTFIRPWLGLLPGDDGRVLMAAAGVDDEYIEVPKIDLEDRGCLNCGKKIKVPDGAKKTMCAWCGIMLNTENRAITCTQCGGLLAIPAGQTTETEHSCPFCGSNWSL